jgi:hypothetical protein
VNPPQGLHPYYPNHGKPIWVEKCICAHTSKYDETDLVMKTNLRNKKQILRSALHDLCVKLTTTRFSGLRSDIYAVIPSAIPDYENEILRDVDNRAPARRLRLTKMRHYEVLITLPPQGARQSGPVSKE